MLRTCAAKKMAWSVSVRTATLTVGHTTMRLSCSGDADVSSSKKQSIRHQILQVVCLAVDGTVRQGAAQLWLSDHPGGSALLVSEQLGHAQRSIDVDYGFNFVGNVLLVHSCRCVSRSCWNILDQCCCWCPWHIVHIQGLKLQNCCAGHQTLLT